MTPNESAERPVPRRSFARRATFSITIVVIPVAFFVLLETVLRLAGQFEEQPLFIRSPVKAEYLQANPYVVKRFFANPDSAPTLAIETVYFLAQKPEGTLRIFVQGGSAAAGFPYGHGASISGMLEQRLRRLMPDKHIEVISTAMSAVNSYTLLDFADEIIEQRPDAVLIYTGHNEYLGLLGVGSVLSSGLSPLLTRATLRLRRFAVYQFAERLLGPAGGDEDTLERRAGHTLMARIARDTAIPYASAKYHKGRSQFRGNLQRLLAKYRRANVPVVVGTLASNERDLPPFVGGVAKGTDAKAFGALLTEGLTALDAGVLDDAERHLDEAVALDDRAAEAWYARGRLLSTRGEHTEARDAFLAAKDRDQLRFRAPEDFNAIVRELAAEHGAYIADVQSALADSSRDGIIGNDLMLEHVHPNVDGYFLLADAYFDALFEAGAFTYRSPLPTDAAARAEIPVSEMDRLFGEYKLERMINDWPFVETRRIPEIPPPTNEVEVLAQQMYRRQLSWTQATGQLILHYQRQGNAAEETRVSLILADALPFTKQPQFQADTALIRAGRAREALRYLGRATNIAPDDVNALLALSHALILIGEYERARERLAHVLQLQPNNATAQNALGELNRRRLGETPE